MTENDAKIIRQLLDAEKVVEIQFIEWGDKPKLVVLPEDGSDYDSTEEYIIEKVTETKNINFKSIDVIKKIFPNVDKIFYYTAFHNVFGSSNKNIVNDEQLYFIIKVDKDFNIEKYWDKDLGFCELLS